MPSSYRMRGQMAQQMEDLLRHYREHEALSLSANDVLERALDALWRREVGFLQPEPAAPVAFAPIRLAQSLTCADCGRELAIGAEAWRAMYDSAMGPPICAACLEDDDG